MKFPYFHHLYRSIRLKIIRKKALQKINRLKTQDEMSSHSYKIMVDVINKKLTALSVNK